MAYVARRLCMFIAVYKRSATCAQYVFEHVFEPAYSELPDDYVIPFAAMEFVSGESLSHAAFTCFTCYDLHS